jgi:lipoyl(octanoyl) transferase
MEYRCVRKDGAPGVYVAGAKVAALGLRVRRGCTFHGLAFNVNRTWSRFTASIHAVFRACR